MTREELAQEDAQMRREDRLNKERHDVAKAHKRAEEARSRSRRRSDRAFSNPQHSSGEGGYSGDGKGYYTQEGRDPAPPPFSGSGYYPKVSAHPTEASVPRPCLMLCSVREENLRPQAAVIIPTIDHPPAIDVANVLPGSLETSGQTSILVSNPGQVSVPVNDPGQVSVLLNDPGRGPRPWPACSGVSKITRNAPNRMDK
jgi:hypothetical protein